ncbi:DEAD/DEAH box helicase [Persicobacter psychrovividus]|uniref:DEAD/DEAH box helicase n=1 Tax=Persicobacter psychrovividus TaxID=387638 RepID=A0ABM7VHN5_9BACT|nr:hypothetical protein PEPS_27380 [Persicobacter psychrovividus]
MSTFADLGIRDAFIQGLTDINIKRPTPIQEQTIPLLMEAGHDFVGLAQTGTGKTAAFGLPLLERINPKGRKAQGLILAPTRELCQQIAKQIFRYTKYSEKIFTEAVYGGFPIAKQMDNLKRQTHIVVATPGRLKDLIDRNAIDLRQVKTVVLDEADEMLSMGFKKEIDEILQYVPSAKDTWLFSATMPREIEILVKKFMSPEVIRVEIDSENRVNKDINHKYKLYNKHADKFKMLTDFMGRQGQDRGVIFCKTKMAVRELTEKLKEFGYATEAIEGDMNQPERDKVMRAFRKNRLQILVATDIFARGIDVHDLAYVVHFQLPEKMEFYTHRAGRTGRAGRKGLSLSLILPNELHRLEGIARELNIKLSESKGK